MDRVEAVRFCHPIADAFPSIAGDAFAALMEDIRLNGQRRPIALYDGLIWDGRARFRACWELGIQAQYRILKSADDPIVYLIVRHDRYGQPKSPERSAALEILHRLDEPEWRREVKTRRSEWIAEARQEFRAEHGHEAPQLCEVCNAHRQFVHAHHCIPLKLQFDLGIDPADHTFNWLCPVHHRHLHMMISVYMTDTRSGAFLDYIPEERLEEWNRVQELFLKANVLFSSYGGLHQNGRGRDSL